MQKVQHAVAEDLQKNGLELESVSLTGLDQTDKEFFNPDNAFDAEGLTKLTQAYAERRKERNDIEQNTEVAIAQKNLEAQTEQKLEIERDQVCAPEAASRRSRCARPSSSAEIETSGPAPRESEAGAHRRRAPGEGSRVRAIVNGTTRAHAIADQERPSCGEKSEEQSQAEAKANDARAEAVKAEQLVITAGEVAERTEGIQLIEADKQAQKQAINISRRRRREAGRHEPRRREQDPRRGQSAQLRGRGRRQGALNEAANKLSPEQIAMNIRMALIQALPRSSRNR